MRQALAFVREHGVVCESARVGSIPSLADAIAGERVAGSWWKHARAKAIFAVTRAVRGDPDVLVCRLAAGKVTFVHARLWPALVRAAARFPLEHLARVREIHTAGGRHALERIPFPHWVDGATREAAAALAAAAVDGELAVLPTPRASSAPDRIRRER